MLKSYRNISPCIVQKETPIPNKTADERNAISADINNLNAMMVAFIHKHKFFNETAAKGYPMQIDYQHQL